MPTIYNFGSLDRTLMQQHGVRELEGRMNSFDNQRLTNNVAIKAANLDLEGEYEVGKGLGTTIRTQLLNYTNEHRGNTPGKAERVKELLPKIPLIACNIAPHNQYRYQYRGYRINSVQIAILDRILRVENQQNEVEIHAASYAFVHWYRHPDGTMNKSGLPSTTDVPEVAENYMYSCAIKDPFQKRLFFRFKVFGANYDQRKNLGAKGVAHTEHGQFTQHETVFSPENTYFITDKKETADTVTLEYNVFGKSDIGEAAIQYLESFSGFDEEIRLMNEGKSYTIMPGAPYTNLNNFGYVPVDYCKGEHHQRPPLHYLSRDEIERKYRNMAIASGLNLRPLPWPDESTLQASRPIEPGFKIDSEENGPVVQSLDNPLHSLLAPLPLPVAVPVHVIPRPAEWIPPSPLHSIDRVATPFPGGRHHPPPFSEASAIQPPPPVLVRSGPMHEPEIDDASMTSSYSVAASDSGARLRPLPERRSLERRSSLRRYGRGNSETAMRNKLYGGVNKRRSNQ